MTYCVLVIGFSLSLCWISQFVPTLWKPSACPCFIRRVKRPWTHYSMLKSTCKCLIDWMCKCFLTSCLFCHRYSSKGAVVKKVSLINKGLFHLIDDIFWNLGFKNETHAEKVTMLIRIIRIICTIRIICIKWFMSIILIISIISQVRTDLGIADNIWQEQRAVIASTIDALGDRFKPELRAGWLAYIRQNYPDGPVEAPAIIGHGTLEIDEWVQAALCLYADWSPVVDVPIGWFPAINTHPKTVLDSWNNKYNMI